MPSWVLQSSAIQGALILFMEYVDLGKWVAAAVGGYHSRLGLPLLLFLNCSAALWQYLANHICLVTEKNLAQICSEQYSKLACVFLGVAVELSMTASDLTKILGVAHGFHVLFDLDLLNSTVLAATVAILLPIVFSCLGSHKLMVLYLSISTFTSLFYVLGVYLSRLEDLSATCDTYSGVNLKNATLMVLLGAQIMPQNFYIHPCIVQQQSRQAKVSKDVVIQTRLFAIIFVFTSIFVVNSVMMNSAASVYNSFGFFVPSFHDVFLLTDQMFRSSAVTFQFCLCFLFSSLVAAITHSHVEKVITRDFFHINLPDWLYHIVSKVFVFVAVLYCTKAAGSEGVYRLLLFFQVVSAFLLPLSVIPLFQLSSSQLIMGVFRISPLLEFLCMIAFTGMLAIIGIFIIELLFGNDEWSVDLIGDMGNDLINFNSFLVFLALTSIFCTLYLFFTPLRPSANKPQTKICVGEMQRTQSKRSESREETDSVLLDNTCQNSIAEITDRTSLDCQHEFSFTELSSRDPKTNMKFVQGSHKFDLVSIPTTDHTFHRMEPLEDGIISGRSDILNLLQHKGFTESNEEHEMVKIGVTPEGIQPSSSSEFLEASYNSDFKVNASRDSMISDKRVNAVGKTAALGLGRGVRRQLAAILDEFWGLLFDYHGKLTTEAKSIRAAILFDLDCQLPHTSMESEVARKELSPAVSSPSNSLIARTIPGAHSSYVKRIGPSSLSPVVQHHDGWPTIQGTEASANYGGFCVQTICSSLEPLKLYSITETAPLALADDSKSKHGEDASKPMHLILGHETFWTKNHFVPPVNFISQDKSAYSPYATLTWGGKIVHSISGASKAFLTYGESERLVLLSLQYCIRKLLGLDGSSCLFSQGGGPDEELIDNLAMTYGLLHKDVPCEADEGQILFLPSMSRCSKGCIWQASIVVSFGVWCVRRILELLLVESRPELWGKYTYVLNRLQGILEPAFCKPRKGLSPCICLEESGCNSRDNFDGAQMTSRSSILELIKGAEASIRRRRGRAGTGAGDVAFPVGKENVSSVLRRYKQKLAKQHHEKGTR